MVIYLALPLLQANKQNLIDQNQSQKGRYQSHLVETHDLFTNATEADISLLRRRAVFKLLDAHSNPDHNLDGFLYLPIGKLNVRVQVLSKLTANLFRPFCMSMHLRAWFQI